MEANALPLVDERSVSTRVEARALSLAERRIAGYEKGPMDAEPVEDVIKAMRDRKR